MRHSTSRTSTTSPSDTFRSRTTPVCGEGTTARAFSASTSTRSAPSSTRSPSSTYHSTISASLIPIDSWGRRTSTSMRGPPDREARVGGVGSAAEGAPHGGDDLLGVRVDLLFQRGAEGHVRVVGGDADDGAAQVAEAVLDDAGGDLAGGAAGAGGRVDDHAVPRPGHRFVDRRPVHRHEGPQVDDLNVDALRGEGRGGLHAEVGALADAHDGDVGAGPADGGDSERYE